MLKCDFKVVLVLPDIIEQDFKGGELKGEGWGILKTDWIFQ